MSVFNRDGFSLVELLVAISLLSIVLLGGFAIFNMLQENYLREAGTSNTVKTARSNADTLFIRFHDNASFNAGTVSAWPQDDNDTADNETDFTLTSLWGDANWLDDNGSFQCRITAIDTLTPSFSVSRSCYTDQGVTTATLENALTAMAIPTVVINGASHGCIIQSITDAATAVFTVADNNCLSDADGTTLTAGNDGAGVIFPRFAVNGLGRSDILNSLYFDHFGVEREGAAIYFGIEDTYRETNGRRYAITSDSSDNFTNSWVKIHDFNDTNALDLINIRDQSHLTLIVETLDNADTGSTLSLSSAGTDSFTRRIFLNRSDDNISATLKSLYVNAPSATGQVDLRFTLGGGAMTWSRDLRLKLE